VTRTAGSEDSWRTASFGWFGAGAGFRGGVFVDLEVLQQIVVSVKILLAQRECAFESYEKNVLVK
jgi:hypothetical protein